MTVRLDHTVTSGTFSLDGGSWQVDNNVWVIGNETECVVIDAPHTAAPIVELIGDRELLAILCTHAHDDHVTVARELADTYRAPVRLHPADEPLWRRTYPDFDFEPLADAERIKVGDSFLEVVHTPGHAPGAVCFRLLEPLDSGGVVFSGDTLFHGGPGATGRSFSDWDTIVASIRERLLTLPPDTVVHTGHGDDTTIADELAGSAGWTRPDRPD